MEVGEVQLDVQTHVINSRLKWDGTHLGEYPVSAVLVKTPGWSGGREAFFVAPEEGECSSKLPMVCGFPDSDTWKELFGRPLTGLPCASVTTTSTTTNLAEARSVDTAGEGGAAVR